MERARTPIGSIEDTYSSRERQDLRRIILSHMEAKIRAYEALYEPANTPAIPESPLTKERYTRFETWLGTLGQGRTYPAEMGQDQLKRDIQQITTGYQALQQLHQAGPLRPEIRIYCEAQLLRKGEFLLSREFIPKWIWLPSQELLKKAYRLDHVAEEYREGRPLEDFTLKNWETMLVGMSGSKELIELRERLLNNIAEGMRLTAPSPAKVLSVEEIIRQIRLQDPDQGERLPTLDIWQFLDQHNLRPATLQELLVYARDHWDADKQELQIYAFGSAFSNEGTKSCFPRLTQFDQECELSFENMVRLWSSEDCLLVFRQD